MSNVKNILTMLNPGQSIMIDENIGLLGISDEDIKHNNELRYIHDRSEKIADYWYVIGKQGYELFKYIVDKVGIIYQGVETIGYCFYLRDFTVTSKLDEIFDTGIKSKAIIIYIDNKLYTNCNNIDIEYDKNISIESIDNGLNILTIHNDRFISSYVNIKNNILAFRELINTQGE